jgi:hypothetical protein
VNFIGDIDLEMFSLKNVNLTGVCNTNVLFYLSHTY